MISPDALIEKLGLEPHPEGGYYKRTHLAADHSFSSILFLLQKNNFSSFHRIGSDEQWNWYNGEAIHLHEIDPDGNYMETILTVEHGKENYQYVVAAHHWFASECKGTSGYALAGCTVVPAFSFDHFELAKRNELAALFPRHSSIIHKFTRQ